MRHVSAVLLLPLTLALLLALQAIVPAAAHAEPQASPSGAAAAAPTTAIRIEAALRVGPVWTSCDSVYTLINRSSRPQPIKLLLGTARDFSGVDFGSLDPGAPLPRGPSSLPPSLRTEETAGEVWLVGDVPAATEVRFVARNAYLLLVPSGANFARLTELSLQSRMVVYQPPAAGSWPLTGLVYRVELPDAGVVIPNDPRLEPEGHESPYLGQPAWRSPVNRLRVGTGNGSATQATYPEPTQRSNSYVDLNRYSSSAAIWELPNLVTDRDVTYDLYIFKPVRAGLTPGWALVLGLCVATGAFAAGVRWQRWLTEVPGNLTIVHRAFRRGIVPVAVGTLLVAVVVLVSLQVYWGYRSPVIGTGRSWVNADYMAAAWLPGEQVNFTAGLLNRSRFPARIIGIRAISLEHGRGLPLVGAVTTANESYAGVGPIDATRLALGFPNRADIGGPAIGARILPGDAGRLTIALSVVRPPEWAPPIDIGEIEITYRILGISHHVYVQFENFGAPTPDQGDK